MGLLRCHSREVVTLAGDRQTEEVDCLIGIWLHFRKNSKHIVFGRITIFSNFFIGIVVSLVNVWMKYFVYYFLYFSVWLFVICFFFCNGYYMDIKAGILSLMLLCCWIPFHFYTVHAGNFSSTTLQFFEIVDFVIIIVVIFNNGFLEYVYNNYNWLWPRP